MGSASSVDAIRRLWNSSPDDNGKLSCIRMIINTDGSRIALSKYLERAGLRCYFDFYFEIEEIKRLHHEDITLDFTVKASSIRQRYSGSNGVACQNIEKILRKNDLGSSAPSEQSNSEAVSTYQKFLLCQDAVLSLMAARLGDFMKSPFYAAWDSNMQQMEGRVEPPVDPFADSNTSLGPFHSGLSDTTEVVRAFPRILVAEDSAVASRVICHQLEQCGHTVERVINGREALEKLSRASYNVLLVDLHMPILNGFETVRLYRQHESTASATGSTTNAGSDRRTPSLYGSDNTGPIVSLSPPRGNRPPDLQFFSVSPSSRSISVSTDNQKDGAESSHSVGHTPSRASLTPNHGRARARSVSLLEPEEITTTTGGATTVTSDEIHTSRGIGAELSCFQLPPPHAASAPAVAPASILRRPPTSSVSWPNNSGTAPSTPLASFPQIISINPSSSSSGRSASPLLIIGMSTDCSESIVNEALSAGVDGFIPKPFLLQRCHAVLKTARATHASRSTQS